MKDMISTFAPTSTPRVGSDRMSILGWKVSHLPRETFCIFPPLSEPTGIKAFGVFMFRLSIWFWAADISSFILKINFKKNPLENLDK
jgi:hypothetical protein